MASIIRCETCGNEMSYDKYRMHGCVTKGKANPNPVPSSTNTMRVGLFVSPKRIDTQSMKLAATEFRGAMYIVRGVSSEDPFCKIAKEMGASVFVATAKSVKELDAEIMKKVDIALMFPSKDSYADKEILKFSINLEGHKVPTVVYPER